MRHQRANVPAGGGRLQSGADGALREVHRRLEGARKDAGADLP